MKVKLQKERAKVSQKVDRDTQKTFFKRVELICSADGGHSKQKFVYHFIDCYTITHLRKI